MTRRILRNAKMIISYNFVEDEGEVEFTDTRNCIMLKSDETFIQFDTPKGIDIISLKDVMELMKNRK